MIMDNTYTIMYNYETAWSVIIVNLKIHVFLLEQD